MHLSLFPPLCLGCGRLLRHERALALCSTCEPEQSPLPPALAERGGVRAPWAYDGPLRHAIVALKFSAALALAGPLGRLLALDERLLQSPSGAAWDLAAAVPLHWRRRWTRGFDQSEEVLRWALTHAPAPAPAFAHRLLVRTRWTPPQTDQSSAPERQHNVADAFAVRRPLRARGLRVLVVDDVTTTGATLQACMAALTAAGAREVGGLALLRAE